MRGYNQKPKSKEYHPRKPKEIPKRKDRPDGSDYERYVEIITAYRDFLRLTALGDEIKLHGRARVPEDKGKLLEWVQSPENLDNVADAFRRTCSGYVSTNRLFAVRSGPVYMDWPAIISMIEAGRRCLFSASSFIEIGGRGKLDADIERLVIAVRLIDQVLASVELSDMLGSLPELSERSGELPPEPEEAPRTE